MNDDQPTAKLQALRAEHRRLDDELCERVAAGDDDMVALARIKKQKLRLKDEIQKLLDDCVPDIIA